MLYGSGVIVLLIFLGIAVSAIILRLGCGLVGVEKPGIGRAMIIVCGAGLANFLGAFLMALLSIPESLGVLIGGAIAAYVYSLMIPTDFVKGVLIWLAQAAVVFVLSLALVMLFMGGISMYF